VNLVVSIETETNNNISYNNKKEVFKQIHFLLCDSCFWCASYVRPNSISISNCPSCYNNKIKWMPMPSVNICKSY
jgi:hypothetical protein